MSTAVASQRPHSVHLCYKNGPCATSGQIGKTFPLDVCMAPSPLNIPLIPRADLFGNPARAYAQISPDGRFLSWLAPVGGVLNIWVGPTEAPERAEVVTDARKRGIRRTYDSGHHLFYLQDTDGNE